MMTEEQHTIVRNYLLTKKLPIDLLMEVQDHFTVQISQTMKEENLDFSAAFDRVADSWRKELRPYWKGGFNLEDASDLVRRMRREIELSHLKWAIKYAFIPVIIIFGAGLVLNSTAFGIISIAIFTGLTIINVSNYIRHYQDFKLARKYQNQVLTLHQHSIPLFFIMTGTMINIFSRFINAPEELQRYLSMQGTPLQFIAVLVPLLLFAGTALYSYSAQKNYLKQISKVKPFLKYL